MTVLLVTMLLEVMDKETSIPGFWIGATVLGAIGFVAARWRRWAALPMLAIVGMDAWSNWSEWADPVVGPAIRSQAGHLYPYHLVASALLAAGLTIAGLVSPRRQPRERWS